MSSWVEARRKGCKWITTPPPPLQMHTHMYQSIFSSTFPISPYFRNEKSVYSFWHGPFQCRPAKILLHDWCRLSLCTHTDVVPLITPASLFQAHFFYPWQPCVHKTSHLLVLYCTWLKFELPGGRGDGAMHDQPGGRGDGAIHWSAWREGWWSHPLISLDGAMHCVKFALPMCADRSNHPDHTWPCGQEGVLHLQGKLQERTLISITMKDTLVYRIARKKIRSHFKSQGTLFFPFSALFPPCFRMMNVSMKMERGRGQSLGYLFCNHGLGRCLPSLYPSKYLDSSRHSTCVWVLVLNCLQAPLSPH